MTTPSERSLEQEIRSKGLNAPRITPDMVDQSIAAKQFYVFPGTTVTVCCLTLLNGFNVVGESAAASPENFNLEIGQKVAFENARNKIWSLLGFELRSSLHLAQQQWLAAMKQEG